MSPPLPVKNGVGPTRLRIPLSGPWATIAEYVVAKFDHLDAENLYRRFDDGEFVDTDGHSICLNTELSAHRFVWYYRELPAEDPVPFHEEILHTDDDLVVIDKPHFLPTTPSGRYLRESALIRLRVRLDNPDLTPIHRLDRGTAGVVMFSARPRRAAPTSHCSRSVRSRRFTRRCRRDRPGGAGMHQRSTSLSFTATTSKLDAASCESSSTTAVNPTPRP